MSLTRLEDDSREIFENSSEAIQLRLTIENNENMDLDKCEHNKIESYPDGKGVCLCCGAAFEDAQDKGSIIIECKHEDLCQIDQGLFVCKDCCEEQKRFDFNPEWRYYGSNDNRSRRDPSRCHYTKGSNSLEATFNKRDIHLPQSIRDETQRKYNKIIEELKKTQGKNTVRGKRKDSIVAACLFHTYHDFGEYRTSDHIRQFFELSQKKMSSGMKEYASTFPEDRKKTISPENLLRWQMTQAGIHIDHYSKIRTIARYLEGSSRHLKRSNPQSVSAAILYFYLCLYPKYKDKLGLSKSKFAERVNLSEITVTKLVKEVAGVAKCQVQV